MKQLKDLKEELLQYNIGHFYIFYGEDFGIKHHYLSRMKTKFDRLQVVTSVDSIAQSHTGGSLFKENVLYVVLNDIDFANWSTQRIQTVINRLDDDTLVVCYEQELPNTTLFKEFSEYATWFPRVKQNIAVQFIDDNLHLLQSSKEDLAYNCDCDYGTILLECDKIKNYSQAANVSEQEAYETLKLHNQLVTRVDGFNAELFMNDLLIQDLQMINYWYRVIVPNHIDDFWVSLSYIFYNILIAYYIKQYGYYEGSKKSYASGLPWNRTKQIRDLNIRYTPPQLITLAYNVCDMDSKVKSGKLPMDNVFDYFMCYIM